MRANRREPAHAITEKRRCATHSATRDASRQETATRKTTRGTAGHRNKLRHPRRRRSHHHHRDQRERHTKQRFHRILAPAINRGRIRRRHLHGHPQEEQDHRLRNQRGQEESANALQALPPLLRRGETPHNTERNSTEIGRDELGCQRQHQHHARNEAQNKHQDGAHPAQRG